VCVCVCVCVYECVYECVYVCACMHVCETAVCGECVLYVYVCLSVIESVSMHVEHVCVCECVCVCSDCLHVCVHPVHLSALPPR